MDQANGAFDGQRCPKEGMMSEFVLTGQHGGGEITDWRAWTRPKKDGQWRAGRSAMELARAWFVSPVPVCPREIADLLASHPLGTGLTLVEGIPEHVTSLPMPGEGRNHDLLLLGHGGSGSVVISVEAKVDEPFGETIGTYWNSASHSDKPTRAPQRIETLLAMAFGAEARPDADPWRGLRYQLLTAVTGTAMEAARRQVSTAVVVVHEFRTERINAEKAQANARDFETFVGVLLRLPPSTVVPGRLYGPVVLAQGEHLQRPVDLFIGKAVFDWRRETQEMSERPVVHRQAA
jgi:hypothetical protein